MEDKNSSQGGYAFLMKDGKPICRTHCLNPPRELPRRLDICNIVPRHEVDTLQGLPQFFLRPDAESSRDQNEWERFLSYLWRKDKVGIVKSEFLKFYILPPDGPSNFSHVGVVYQLEKVCSITDGKENFEGHNVKFAGSTTHAYEPSNSCKHQTHAVKVEEKNDAWVDPSYLQTLGQVHSGWIFGAIAEFVDNSRDAKATKLEIFIETIYSKKDGKNIPMLSVIDNGHGMTHQEVVRMTCFGHKQPEVDDLDHIGRFGVGFKTGTMRLGRDALVLTQTKNSRSIAFLSQSLNEGKNDLEIPIVSYIRKVQFIEVDTSVQSEALAKSNLKAIKDFSPFDKYMIGEKAGLFRDNPTGTQIFIWNLDEWGSNYCLEWDDGWIGGSTFHQGDIRIRSKRIRSRPGQISQKVPLDYSLRSYLEVIFLVPQIRIYVQGSLVKSLPLAKSLNVTCEISGSIIGKTLHLTLGRCQLEWEQANCGIFLYWHGRLIEAYKRVGGMIHNADVGRGVIGVIDVTDLMNDGNGHVWVHSNKQGFQDCEPYALLEEWLGKRADEYWDRNFDELQLKNGGPLYKPDHEWVQCDKCRKWRMLCSGFDSKILPSEWYCYMKPFEGSCDIPEQKVGHGVITISAKRSGYNSTDVEDGASLTTDEIVEAQESWRVGVFYDPIMLKHRPPQDGTWYEVPDRLVKIKEALDDSGLYQRCVSCDTVSIPVAKLGNVHEESYGHIIQGLDQTDNGQLGKEHGDRSVYTSIGSSEAAFAAAGSLIEVCRRVALGDLDCGFAIVRPPGHHATARKAMGFCLLNNIALAAQDLLGSCYLKKILIVDWDIHHGNGTQEAFYTDPRVLYFSVHRYGNDFYPCTGPVTDIGDGEGLGYTINVPLTEQWYSDLDYLAIWKHILLPITYSFQPEIILISAGFDAAAGDPLGKCLLSPTGFSLLLLKLLTYGMGRVVLSLEGGYNLISLAECAVACLFTLLESKVYMGEFRKIKSKKGMFSRALRPETRNIIQEVQDQLDAYWHVFEENLPEIIISKAEVEGEVESINNQEVKRKKKKTKEKKYRSIHEIYESTKPVLHNVENEELVITKDARIYYPSRDDPEHVEINCKDIDSLAPQSFLTLPIMNFYIRHLRLQASPRDKATCGYYLLNTFFYEKLEQAVSCEPCDRGSCFLEFRKQWKGINVFQKAYVLVPIQENLHWSLAMICIPDKKDESGPILFHLVSSGSHCSTSVFSNIKSYLEEEWKYMNANQEIAISDLPISDKIWKELPQTIVEKRIVLTHEVGDSDSGLFVEDYDSGLFIFFFMERFIENVSRRLAKKDLAAAIPQDLAMLGKQWFRPKDASDLREKIQNLLVDAFQKAC